MYNKTFEGDVCSHSLSIFLDNFIRRIIQNPKKILGEYIHTGDTTMDIGCGPGYFTLDRIQLHQCTQEKIGLKKNEMADFILTYYMVHETLNSRTFLSEIYGLLKPGGKVSHC